MLAIPEPQQVTIASQELLARTEPGLLDLAIAIATGALIAALALIRPLADDLAAEFEQEVEVTVRWIKEELTEVTASP